VLELCGRVGLSQLINQLFNAKKGFYVEEILSKNQEMMIIEALKQCLTESDYSIKFLGPLSVRAIGVQDDEFFFALSNCRILKKGNIDAT
jgi:hypothetical protein